jgi:hypothetical protein
MVAVAADAVVLFAGARRDRQVQRGVAADGVRVVAAGGVGRSVDRPCVAVAGARRGRVAGARRDRQVEGLGVAADGVRRSCRWRLGRPLTVAVAGGSRELGVMFRSRPRSRSPPHASRCRWRCRPVDRPGVAVAGARRGRVARARRDRQVEGLGVAVRVVGRSVDRPGVAVAGRCGGAVAGARRDRQVEGLGMAADGVRVVAARAVGGPRSPPRCSCSQALAEVALLVLA